MQGPLNDIHMDELFDAILKLNTREECYAFFEDLCTVSELLAMRQRFWVATMLREGRIYTDIAEATGASSATISRVSRCLNYGKTGYKNVLEKMEQDNDTV